MISRRALFVWLPVALWMTMIFFGSTDLMSAEHTSRFLTPFLRWLNPGITLATLAQAHLLARKAAHLTEYAILAALLFRAWRATLEGFGQRAGAALGVAVLFALGDEFHQRFVPSRTGSIYDVMIDSCGALLGLLLCGALYRWFENGATRKGNGPERI